MWWATSSTSAWKLRMPRQGSQVVSLGVGCRSTISIQLFLTARLCSQKSFLLPNHDLKSYIIFKTENNKGLKRPQSVLWSETSFLPERRLASNQFQVRYWSSGTTLVFGDGRNSGKCPPVLFLKFHQLIRVVREFCVSIQGFVRLQSNYWLLAYDYISGLLSVSGVLSTTKRNVFGCRLLTG